MFEIERWRGDRHARAGRLTVGKAPVLPWRRDKREGEMDGVNGIEAIKMVKHGGSQGRTAQPWSGPGTAVSCKTPSLPLLAHPPSSAPSLSLPPLLSPAGSSSCASCPAGTYAGSTGAQCARATQLALREVQWRRQERRVDGKGLAAWHCLLIRWGHWP